MSRNAEQAAWQHVAHLRRQRRPVMRFMDAESDWALSIYAAFPGFALGMALGLLAWLVSP